MPALAKTDIYRGGSPIELPLYQIAEAAHYLCLPVATVRSWTVGRHYPVELGTKHFKPLIVPVDRDGQRLSFCNLVELHVLSSMRTKHKLQIREVRRAIDYLEKQFRSKHPLLQQDMLTDGKELFIERYGNLVTISQGGQMALKKILELYLDRIDRDPHGIPIRLFPFTRQAKEPQPGSPRSVAIDPAIRFGTPCIAGTRIPTSMIRERYAAGDSTEFLAADYGRSREEIEEAIRYESRVAA
jgi:uncharacterized protein (DUF433 family)